MAKKSKTSDDGKVTRLDIRMHPRLKDALQEYCDSHLETITEAVTNAIKRYIDFEKTIENS